MRFFSGLLLLLSFILAGPCLVGCSGQLSEEETPVVASDEDESDATPNDPENP